MTHCPGWPSEAAARATDNAITAASRVHSHRALQAITLARTDLTPHQTNPTVSATLERLHTQLPQTLDLAPTI